jgi:hypothetical protein
LFALCKLLLPNYQKIQLCQVWITLGARSNPQQCVFFNIFSDDENVVYTVGCVVVGGCGHFLGHLW